MIDPKCFEKQWLESCKNSFRHNIDISLLERTIYAFELLSRLANIKRDFIFKGGTSLILLLPGLKRLSIDIDVIGKFSEEELSSIVGNSVFHKLDHDKRTSDSKIPKKHFKFYYTSKIDSSEKYILLDILDSSNPYSNTIEQIISNKLFFIKEESKVKLPSVSDILGDKLTAFAPHTTGISYGSDKSLEIIKQLYDLHNLFDFLTDKEAAISTYTKIALEQFSYRNLKLTSNDSLKDTFQTAVKLCKLDFKGSIEDVETKELRKGIQGLSGFLIDNDFNLQIAKTAASKIALLSTIFRFPNTKINLNDMLYNETRLKLLKDFQLSASFGSLNKLKKINVEAFYYWYLISKLTDDNEWLTP
ncbi:MAG: nucleotidyl transferase AbiEii/AbiGii toxin family protein [Ignavibacteriaceae bacterium]|nr:nucleotidyl transferase AbiEii/AbiGii toxin family protein [Ignavibacteriaceae bacterium]